MTAREAATRSTEPRIAIVGLGLIGGSLLRRLPDAVGFDVDEAARTGARGAGLAAAERLDAAVDGAELVIVATPIAAIPPVLQAIAESAPDVLVTDVASVKAPVRTAARGRRYVGGHPMAGTERSGFTAGSADLFADAAWALCLEDDTDLEDWLRVATVVTGLGARVVPTTAADHDAAVAAISHLPHLLAATLASLLDPLAATLAAGSFRDATRVAATRPELPTVMCVENAGPLADVTDAAVRRLTAALHAGPTGIAGLFEQGHAARTAMSDRSSSLVRFRRAAGAAGAASLRAELLTLGTAGGWVDSLTTEEIVGARPSAR